MKTILPAIRHPWLALQLFRVAVETWCTRRRLRNLEARINALRYLVATRQL